MIEEKSKDLNKKLLKNEQLDKIAINVRSHRLLSVLLKENPQLETIMRSSKNETEALVGVKQWMMDYLTTKPRVLEYYRGQARGRQIFESLEWKDYAAIRILDYIDNAGREFPDPNLRGEMAINNPIKMIWLAVNHGTGGAKPAFFRDTLELFRQFKGRYRQQKPKKEQVLKWMQRFPDGMDPRIVKLREENRERIINSVIKRLEEGRVKSGKFAFREGMSFEQKYLQVMDWWKDYRFHLSFAVRTADDLNEMLGYSLDPDTMKILHRAEKKGIPIFVNPYYLSLLHVRVPYFAIGADLAIRYYVLYSTELVHEFGNIVAWEKEDQVVPGKPNAAGWILPSHYNVHRRYPDVAILIPDTMGRACGGLCASCQRMYNFQNGHLNFDLEKLKPRQTWSEKLRELMSYFEEDSQLRDILITGGDALMSSNRSLENILNEIYRMAKSKRDRNRRRKAGEKYAEMVRVRIGTRLPVYLPQRFDTGLLEILSDFRTRAEKIGIRQFVIQTHFESPMEITPESSQAVQKLIQAGWTVTNQHVLTTASSRRGHTAKLRQALNDIGVLPYYTFSVKGYMENHFNFATNARAVQEQVEEKHWGRIPRKYYDELNSLTDRPEKMAENLQDLKGKIKAPFLATDRNVLNLPGVGKSLTFRVIGITRYGRRILEFDHDRTRAHSPIIEKMGKVVIIESKSISEYLKQLEELGEDPREYHGIFGYSLGETEFRLPVYEYPVPDYRVTDTITNLEIP